MKIKEIAKLVDISAANIRYYEKEGLLSPNRNEENNYREYSEEDLIRLKDIKKLRLLGINISTIQSLYQNKVSLEDVMRNRIMELEAEKKNLNLTKQVCQKAIDQHLDMERLDSLSINEKAEVWQRKLAVIMKEDTVKIPLTKKEFNFHIAIMMA